MRNRRAALAISGVALLALMAVRHPNADIRILAHDAGDPAPHRIVAAVDLGLAGVSLLVTWSGKHLIDRR